MWSFAIYTDLALAVTTLTTPSIELSCEEGACFLGGLLSWDTAVLLYITGKCYFYHKSASASGSTSSLNAVPASPVGISVVTQTNAAICLFLHPQVALWHCSPLTCLLICAKSSCAVLPPKAHPPYQQGEHFLPSASPQLSFGYFGKEISTAKSCFAL